MPSDTHMYFHIHTSAHALHRYKCAHTCAHKHFHSHVCMDTLEWLNNTQCPNGRVVSTLRVHVRAHTHTETFVLRQPSQRGRGQFRSVYKGGFVSRLSAKHTHTQTHLMTALCPHFKARTDAHIDTYRDQLLCTLIMSLLGSDYLGLQTRAGQTVATHTHTHTHTGGCVCSPVSPVDSGHRAVV